MGRRRNLGCELRDLIFYLYSDTLVPELFDMLGEDKAIRFIQMFGGIKIEIPSFKRVVELQRNIEIYENLAFINTEETVKDLADKHNITTVWVREIFRKMKKNYPAIEKFLITTQEQRMRVTTKRSPRAEDPIKNQETSNQHKVQAQK